MKSPKELGCPNEQWLGVWCVLAHLSLAREHGGSAPNSRQTDASQLKIFSSLEYVTIGSRILLLSAKK